MAGIDTTIFKGHSFKGASSSKAVTRAGWKNAVTFAKFYDKTSPVSMLPLRSRFAGLVLQPYCFCSKIKVFFNPLRPNNDLSQTSHCNIKSLSVSEVMRIENMITSVKSY